MRAALAKIAVTNGFADIDAATIRMSAPRAFTQAISRYVYDRGAFSGVRYLSRFGDDAVNWAVFETFSAVRPHAPIGSIDFADPDFIEALRIHGLRIENPISTV